MATIYEIDRAILDCLDMETGEVLDVEALDALQIERSAKLENLALYVKNLTSEAAAIKAEEAALAERRKAKENKVERLKAYLSDALGGQPFETAKVRLSFRASTGVIVTDGSALMEWLKMNHDECLKYTAPAVNKTEVGKLLKSGVEVPGAELETRSNLQMK